MYITALIYMAILIYILKYTLQPSLIWLLIIPKYTLQPSLMTTDYSQMYITALINMTTLIILKCTLQPSPMGLF